MTNLIDRSLIVKLCKRHGALMKEETVERKRGEIKPYLMCRQCKRDSEAEYKKNNYEKVKASSNIRTKRYYERKKQNIDWVG